MDVVANTGLGFELDTTFPRNIVELETVVRTREQIHNSIHLSFESIRCCYHGTISFITATTCCSSRFLTQSSSVSHPMNASAETAGTEGNPALHKRQ